MPILVGFSKLLAVCHRHLGFAQRLGRIFFAARRRHGGAASANKQAGLGAAVSVGAAARLVPLLD